MSNDQGPFGDIAVGVGGSQSAYSALRYAFDLADHVQGRVTAIIVDEMAPPSVLAIGGAPDLAGFLDRAHAAANLHAEEIESQVRAIADERTANIEVQIEEGNVAACLATAGELATLVAIGKHGHGEAHGGLLGSNAEQIVRRVKVPVLVSPREHHDVDEIIVAYAAKEPGRMNLRVGLGLQRAFDRPLVVFTAQRHNDTCQEILSEARKELADELDNIRYESHVGDSANAIVHRTSKRSLLVMGAYGRSRLYHMILGSVTEEVIRAARGPVILTRKLVSRQ